MHKKDGVWVNGQDLYGRGGELEIDSVANGSEESNNWRDGLLSVSLSTALFVFWESRDRECINARTVHGVT